MVSAWIANAVSYAAAAILRQIFPSFARLELPDGLGFTGFEAGLVTSGTGLGMLAIFLLFGKFHFWHFRFRHLILGQALSVIGCVLFAACSGKGVLFAGACLFGTGAGIAYISSIYYSLEGQTARAGQSGLHEGILCFGFTAGMIITAIITRYLTSHRTPYWICVVMLLAGIAAQVGLYARARRAAE